MCNLAGYIGPGRAAPILINMLERQEGFGGGYHTGIATIFNGKLYYRKVIGAVDELLRKTDALKLPGNIGVIHSRSNGFGNIEWGHPFINPDESIAYVANGHMGNFYSDKDNERNIINNLIAQGYKFRTRIKESAAAAQHLGDGSSVHMSEVMCFHVDCLCNKYPTVNEAFLNAAGSYSAEVVGLLLCEKTPGSIHAVRFNQPLMIGRKGSETFLSSTALAFPENLESIVQAPIRSAMEFNRGDFEVRRLPDKTGPVADIFPFYDGCKIIGKMLLTGKGYCFQDFKNATAKLWSSNMAPQKDMMVYEILRLFKSQNRICFEQRYTDGKIAGLKAPLKYIVRCRYVVSQVKS